jgi:N-dimethylarginine dimethylaminohydrolase
MGRPNLSQIPYYTPGKPHIPPQTNYLDELVDIWGERWGAQSEIGRLRMVMMHRPEEMVPPEVEEDPIWFLYRELPDLERAQEQWDDFAEIFKESGVKVIDYAPGERVRGAYLYETRAWAPRDGAVVVRGGAIICRMSLVFRKGLERYIARKLMEMGCPILYTVHGDGFLEGGNFVWLDPERVAVGLGVRGNEEGIEQVRPILRRVGVEEIILVPLPGYVENIRWPSGGFVHLDVVFAMADHKLALIYPPGIPYTFLLDLKRRGVELIEVYPEEAKNMACNIVALEPGKVIIPSGNERTTKELERRGVEVIEVEFSEFIKAGGGPHCATCPIIREEENLD